ncbi:MAG: alkaline phosphatase family protein [Gemmatimonadota bacterium]
MARVLFVFLDGVGIGHADPARNPMQAAALPTLTELLGGTLPTLSRPRIGTSLGRSAAAFPLDAGLDRPGLPQSGTGQTTLLTGENAVVRFGRHFGPWVPVSLRPLVRDRSLLKLAVDRGHTVTFANAYPRSWARSGQLRRIAAPPLAALGAGLLHRSQRELALGQAVSSEIVNDGWRARWQDEGIPKVTPVQAGRILARLAADHELTFYAHYATDTAGHRGDAADCRAALERVDRFLAGVLETLPEDHLLLVASDHGNIEELGAGHTRNPALGILAGPDAPARSLALTSLTHPAAAILDWLATPA